MNRRVRILEAPWKTPVQDLTVRTKENHLTM